MEFDLMTGGLTWKESSELAVKLEAAGFSGMLFTEAGTVPWMMIQAAAMARFDADRREAAKSTTWNTGCKSWYLDAAGLPSAWPWTFDRFIEEMSEPRLSDYEMK